MLIKKNWKRDMRGMIRKMTNDRYFPQIAFQISLSALISMVFAAISLMNGQARAAAPVLFIVYSVLVFLVNRVFAKKTHTLSRIAVINVISGVLVFLIYLFGSLLITGHMPVFWQSAFGLIAVLIVTATAARFTYAPVKISLILTIFDANVVVLILSVLLISPMNQPLTWVIFSIAGAVSGLFGAISLRQGEGFGRREFAVIVFLFIVIAVIAWILFAFVVEPLSSGAEGLGRGLASGFVFIWNQFERFLKFLASLGGDKEGAGTEGIGVESGGGYSSEEAEYAESTDTVIPVIIAALIIIAVIIAVIVFFRKLGKSKVRRKSIEAGGMAVYTQKTTLADAVNRIIERFRRRRNSRRYLSQHKDHPEGIYFRLEKDLKRTVLEKRPGDTPKEFLMRIRDAYSAECKDNNIFTERLDKLVIMLDENLYSKRPENTALPWADEFIRRVRELAKQSH